MSTTFKSLKDEFDKSNLSGSLYRIVVAEEVADGDYKELIKTEEEFELVCNYIYDWFCSSSSYSDITEMVSTFINCLYNGLISLQMLKDDYDKVDEIINNSI